jgi:hypothetical protein
MEISRGPVAQGPYKFGWAQYHQISGLRLRAVFRRRNVVMGIDVRWVSRGRRDVVSYHKWMTSHNFIRMYTIRLVFNRKRVHFTSGSFFGPCEKTFSPFFRSLKRFVEIIIFPITIHSSAVLGLSKILFFQNNGNTEMLNKCPRDNDPTKQQITKPHLYT